MSSTPAVIANEPQLPPALVERVLAKLGLERAPSLDLQGLNRLYAAICERIPFDNVQKRIWFANGREKPATGGDAAEFFENWLKHGTGGTCWPTNGGMYALARALGFHARRTAGSVVIPNYPLGANHGSVLIDIDGAEYVFDLPFGSFQVLPLVPGKAASTDTDIHNLRALPLEGGFELYLNLGWVPAEIPYRPEPEHGLVDHAFFLRRYDIANQVGFFNATLLAMRRFRDSVITVGRGKKLVRTRDGIAAIPISDAERNAVLIGEIGLSEEIVRQIPRDAEGTAAF